MVISNVRLRRLSYVSQYILWCLHCDASSALLDEKENVPSALKRALSLSKCWDVIVAVLV